MADKTYQQIAAEYAPYNSHPAFDKGAEAFMAGTYACPFADGVSIQAWDRGMEAAMRYARQFGGRH